MFGGLKTKQQFKYFKNHPPMVCSSLLKVTRRGHDFALQHVTISQHHSSQPSVCGTTPLTGMEQNNRTSFQSGKQVLEEFQAFVRLSLGYL